MRGELPFLLAGVVAFAAIARAEPTKIGEAEVIRNEVVSVEGAALSPIVVGDTIVRDEVVRTSADSDARIGLIDSTKLALGPNSILKIDRAVYSDDARYKQIVINLTAGAFRFVTGNSNKKSYKIETPTASIGVRGTILDILISETQTLVTLQEGQATVCVGKKCAQLLERGHTANVTRDGGVIQIKRDLVPTWTFASVCSNNSQLCPPLPLLTKKASLPTQLPKAAKEMKELTRLCPNGQSLVGDSCVPSLTRDSSLRGPSDIVGTSSVPTITPTMGQVGVPSGLGVPSTATTSGPGISLPRLGR